jgi:hypothetical protein
VWRGNIETPILMNGDKEESLICHFCPCRLESFRYPSGESLFEFVPTINFPICQLLCSYVIFLFIQITLCNFFRKV